MGWKHEGCMVQAYRFMLNTSRIMCQVFKPYKAMEKFPHSDLYFESDQTFSAFFSRSDLESHGFLPIFRYILPFDFLRL